MIRVPHRRGRPAPALRHAVRIDGQQLPSPSLFRPPPGWWRRARVLVALATALAASGRDRPSAQVTAENFVHYGAPCPAPTKYDRWCLPGEAVVGRELFVPGGSTRVLRVEVPARRPITRIQLTMITRAVQCGCALFDLSRGDRLGPSVCQPYEQVPAGRAIFGIPQINGEFVTVTFTSQEPYVQEAFLRVYYRK
jgi:hypothetical protein